MAAPIESSPLPRSLGTDQNDRDLLLEACNKGHYERARKIIDEGKIDCTGIENEEQQTLVHIAASKGYAKLVKLLLEKKVDSLKIDRNKQTALMCACDKGHFRVAKVLLELVPETKDVINLQDRGKLTALHLAASGGHLRIAELLLKYGASGCIQARHQRTPMMWACINCHVEVVELLLKEGMEGSPVTYLARNAHGELMTDSDGNNMVVSVLMEAINRELEEIAMAIMESRQVKEALEYKTIIDGKEMTPLRLLFQRMPEVAERAFVYCTDQPKPEDRGNDRFKFDISFRYHFLEDFVHEKDSKSCYGSTESSTPIEQRSLIANADVEPVPPTLPPWKPTRYDKTNHCLNVLIKSKSKVLVRHPIVTTLLYQKWNRHARYFFIVAFLFHTLFAGLLTAFALLTLQPMSSICIEARHYNNVTSCGVHDKVMGNSHAIISVGVIVIIMAVLRLLFDGLYLVQLKLNYFKDWINYLQILEFTGSIIFVFVFTTKCFCPFPWQWQIGAGCVFLAWIDLILFIRLIPAIGIYVVMLLKIFMNYLKVAALGISLVLAFTFPLYMLFHDPRLEDNTRTPFSNPGETFIKTLTMTTGGVDFDALFKQQGSSSSEGTVQYVWMSYLVIFLFLVLMTILLNNLLTGLAVGDVNQIQENATTKTLSLWVEFIMQCEEMLLGLGFLRKPSDSTMHLNNLKEFPNMVTRRFWFSALRLDFFEIYNNRIISPDVSKFNEKLMKKVNHLSAEMDNMQDMLDDLVLS